MTEIRIYEDHNKVVICAETKNMYDRLFEIREDPSCEEEWHDEEWTYMRMPLTEFMKHVQRMIKS